MNAAINKRVERALDHADAVTTHEQLTSEQKANRREFGRGFLRPFGEVEQMMKGEIPWPQGKPTLKDKIAGWKALAEEPDDEEN